MKCMGLQISMKRGSVLTHYPFHRHDSNDPSIKLPFNINLTHNDTHTLLVAHSKECTGFMTSDLVSVNSNDINLVCREIQYSGETCHLKYNKEKQYHDATSNFKCRISRIDC